MEDPYNFVGLTKGIQICSCHFSVVGNCWSGVIFRNREEKTVTETGPSTVSLALGWGWRHAEAQPFSVS